MTRMHSEILSERERKMLEQFLENGGKGEGFRMLKLRIRRNYLCLSADYELIKKAKEELG